MAKFYGSNVKTGKMGGSVFRINRGTTIESQYQPVVANPKSTAQIGVRARLKLISQLSAVLGNVIAIPSVGMVSVRNQFTKRNFALSTFTNDEADINLSEVQLTNSVVELPNIVATRGAENVNVYVSDIQGIGALDLSRVVYVMLAKRDNAVRVITSAIATNAGQSGTWIAHLPLVNDEIIILAYGMRDDNRVATVIYGDLVAPTAADVAKLIVSRQLSEGDYTLTRTKGITLPAA